jgi:hypothetical protein
MIARDNERQATFRYTPHGATHLRTSHHKRAEMVVQMTCLEDSSKQFDYCRERLVGRAGHVSQGSTKPRLQARFSRAVADNSETIEV